MALSRLEVDRFMVGGKSQKQAADYFGVTTRYIRKILATPSAVSSSVGIAAPGAGSGAVDWVRVSGERGLHRVVVAPHNHEEQPAKEEQPALVPVGTTAFPLPVAAPTPHNASTAAYPRRVVVRPAHALDRLDFFGWFLSASVGPVPIPALVLAVLLFVAVYGGR
jgi:hypothetical protein